MTERHDLEELLKKSKKEEDIGHEKQCAQRNQQSPSLS